MLGLIYSGLVSLAVALLTFILQGVIKENHKLKKEREQKTAMEEDAIRDGVQCLLRDRLMCCHDKHVESDSITIYEYEAWTHMYKAYVGLNGNGMVKHMNDDIEAIKLKS